MRLVDGCDRSFTVYDQYELDFVFLFRAPLHQDGLKSVLNLQFRPAEFIAPALIALIIWDTSYLVKVDELEGEVVDGIITLFCAPANKPWSLVGFGHLSHFVVDLTNKMSIGI